MSSPNPNSAKQPGPAKHNNKKKKKITQHQQSQAHQHQGIDTQQGRQRSAYTDMSQQHYSRGNPDEYLAQQQHFSQHPQEGYGYSPGIEQYPGVGFYQQRGHGVQHPQGPDRQPAYGLPHHLHQQNYGPELNYRPQQNYGPEQNYRPHQNYGPEHNYGPQQNYAPQYNQHGSLQQPGQRQQDHRPRGQGPRTPRGGSGGARQRTKQQNSAPMRQFEQYCDVTEVQQGLKRGELIEGVLRINPKNYEDAYIPHPDGHSDIYISGMKSRNRALNGDVVAIQLFDRDQWKVLLDDLNSMSKKDLEKSMEQMRLDDRSEADKSEDAVTLDPAETEAAMKPDEAASSERTEVSSDAEVIIEEEYYEMVTPDADSATLEDSSQSTEQPSNIKKEQDSVSKGGENSRKQQGKMHSKTQGKEGDKKTPKKKYTSLSDLASDSSTLSPSAKKLFGKVASDSLSSPIVPNNVLMRTGKVVYILEKKHSRACTGHIRLMHDRNPEVALFSPLDNRLPRIHVPMDNCPKDFMERPEDHSKTLFIARITDWLETSMFAMGELKRSLGEAGQIEPETEGILIENDVDFAEFSEEALACLPQQLPWCIPSTEIPARKDLRKQCIFTIDPATARDLDDALSCVSLGNGRYEIGVHIADVSYFLAAGTDLDKVAASRATSVYMVQKVVPMLPRLLCEKLCSLNPDEDRLTFSVIWTIMEDGTVESEWFGRSIIRSCVKLSYDHAQGFIEEPTREWSSDELPVISEGYSSVQIRDTVLLLDKVAKKLRIHRFENGALRLDQIKLQFALDGESGLPNGYYVYHQRDSNRLVEEFMLLANMAVSRKIYSHFPDIAVLRRHPQPQSRMIDDLGKLCKQLGVPLDVTSSKTIQDSLAVYGGDGEDDKAKFLILTSLCSKPMQTARYFCTGVLDDECMYRHYALNVPFYTHFTSPIRRYPDVMVHRLLAASLGYCEASSEAKGEVQKEAEHCNDKKTNAKRCSDLSSELYFSVFVKECGPLEERGMVMGVLDKAFDVLIIKLGVIKRVYCEKLPLSSFNYRKEMKNPQLSLHWAKNEMHPQEKRQFITIFTHVNCRLASDPDPLKWSAVVLHPDDVLST